MIIDQLKSGPFSSDLISRLIWLTNYSLQLRLFSSKGVNVDYVSLLKFSTDVKVGLSVDFLGNWNSYRCTQFKINLW